MEKNIDLIGRVYYEPKIPLEKYLEHLNTSVEEIIPKQIEEKIKIEDIDFNTIVNPKIIDKVIKLYLKDREEQFKQRVKEAKKYKNGRRLYSKRTA